jgi:hypothetical protein
MLPPLSLLNVEVYKGRKMRNWIERYGPDVIIFLAVACIIAMVSWGVAFFVCSVNKQIDRAVKHADEQTARIWPEDRYGEIESFFDVMDHGEGEGDPLNEWRETIAKADGGGIP